eukprot:gene21678-28051_t
MIQTKKIFSFEPIHLYETILIQPTHQINEALIKSECQSSIIRILSSHDFYSKTKEAFWEFDGILSSLYILEFIDDINVRKRVRRAMNRTEAYYQLCRAIAYLKGGNFKGRTEIEIEIWNECTRLVASAIMYYNTYILSLLYEQFKDDEKMRELIIQLSPVAWGHMSFTGQFDFSQRQQVLEVQQCICVVKTFAQAPTMIWRETLNFTWQGKTILVPNTANVDDVNDWHLSKSTILTDAYVAGGRPNFAVTHVPFLFSSGWSEPVGARDNQALTHRGTFSQRIQKATGCPSSQLRFLSDAVTRTLHFENNTNGAYLHPPHFQPSQNTFRRKSDFLNTLLENGTGAMPRIRSDDTCRSRFCSRFYDTEQTIYLTLQRAFNWGFVPENSPTHNFFNPDNPNRIPEGSVIHLCKIDIASYLDMCLDCGDTGYALIRTKRGLSESIINALNKWNIQTSPGFTCAIEVSSRRVTSIPASPIDALEGCDKDLFNYYRTILPDTIEIQRPENLENKERFKVAVMGCWQGLSQIQAESTSRFSWLEPSLGDSEIW